MTVNGADALNSVAIQANTGSSYSNTVTVRTTCTPSNAWNEVTAKVIICGNEIQAISATLGVVPNAF